MTKQGKRKCLDSEALWIFLAFALAALLLAVPQASSAKWVWRDGRWIEVKEDEEEERVEPAGEPEARRDQPPPIPELPEAGQKPVTARRAKGFWAWFDWSGRKTDVELFSSAKTDYQNERFGDAERKFKRLIKQFDQSPYRSEAMWLRAEALFKKGDYYNAFVQYEALLNEYAGTQHFGEALQREFAIAEIYFGPTRRKVLGLPLFSGDDEAVEILRKVYERQPTGGLADEAIIRIADHYYDHQFPLEAEHYYAKYVSEFPDRKDARKAWRRAAECAIAQCKGPAYGTSSLEVARDRLGQFQVAYPKEAEEENVEETLKQIRASQAEKEYLIARYYRRAGRPGSAAFYAERVVKNYADTPWAERAAELLDQMSDKGGRKK